jgi:hypothetical protein
MGMDQPPGRASMERVRWGMHGAGAGDTLGTAGSTPERLVCRHDAAAQAAGGGPVRERSLGHAVTAALL